MATPVFVDPESSTQVDRAQSSGVPVPLSKDPYEAIRQAYLVGTDTESEPFEGKARTHESPHIVVPPTCHVEETARMAVHVPHVMSPGLSDGIAEVAAMSDSAFRKSEEDEEVEESPDSDSESEGAEDEGPTTEDEDHVARDEGLAARVEGLDM
nr:hypothetical protein [Tanacetum cinerariifolium]